MKMIPILLLQFRTGCFCAVTSKTWKALAFKLLRKSTGQLHDNLKEMPSFVASGTAGTGKSYLIWCLQELLGDQLRVMAPTGAAAYNVHGHTLHSLLSIPV